MIIIIIQMKLFEHQCREPLLNVKLAEGDWMLQGFTDEGGKANISLVAYRC